MKILVIHSRDLEKASTKFRIVLYEHFLKEQGVRVDYVKRTELDEKLLAKLPDYDCVINQKCLMNRSVSKAIIRQSKRLIFDFDDAIFTRPGRPYGWLTRNKVLGRLHLWLRSTDVVTAANDYLADYAKHYSNNVVTLPMAVDLNHWRPVEKQDNAIITIGWAGAPVNLHNVSRLEPVFKRLLEQRPNVRIAIFSGERPQLDIPYQYYPFKPGSEADFCQQLDIGLLPLHTDEFSKGKSPIKSIQYLACGIPVVGNIAGATAEILNPENSIGVTTDAQWLSALLQLIDYPERRKKMGLSARQWALDHYNVEKTRTMLLNVINGQQVSQSE